MRRHSRFFTACCALAAILASAGRPAFAQTGRSPVVRVLPNGLKVVVVEDRALPVVETGMWYRFGADDETPGKTGLAHALEHMMFRGTRELSAAGLQAFSARVSARMNAQTTEDYTHYYFIVPSDLLETVLRIEADRMQHLALRSKDWEVERGAVLSEVDNATSNPVARFFSTVRSAVAGTDGPPVLGKRADIERASVSDLRAYYERWYVPNNATLVIAGDVDANEALATAERAFGAIAAKGLPGRTAPPPAVTERRIEEKAQFPFEIIDLAYRSPNAKEPAAYALQNLSFLVNDDRSPFFKNIVQPGLAILGVSIPDFNGRYGTFHASYVVAPGHTSAQVRKAFETTLASLVKNGFPADLVADERTKILADGVYERDSLTGLETELGSVYGIEEVTLARDDELTAAVTPASVAAAAKAYLAAPTIVGNLLPQSKDLTSAAPPGNLTGGVSDTFSGRIPDGEVVQPPYVSVAGLRRTEPTSKLAPAIFDVGGIKLLVQEIHGNHTALVRGFVRTSPSFDPPGKEGLGATVAALTNYGGGTFDFESSRRILGRLGAQLTLGSSIEAHCYAKDLDAVVGVLADGMMHPAFAQQYVDLVVRQQVQALSGRDAIPDYVFERTYRELLLPKGDPELREATPQTMSAIGRADLSAYAARYLRPELTTIAVVGDVDPAAVKATFERAFAGWKGEGPTPDASLPSIPAPEPLSRAIATPSQVINVRLGQPGISRSSPDYYALMVLNVLLGGGSLDSRLMTELRQKRGLVYNVASTVAAGHDRGTIQFDLTVAPKNLTQALTILKTEIRKARDTTPTPYEVDSAKHLLIAQAFVHQESLSDIADDLVDIGSNDLPANYFRKLSDRYRSVTPASVRDVARKYLRPDRLVTVFAGPVNR